MLLLLRQTTLCASCLALLTVCVSCSNDSGTDPQNTPPQVADPNETDATEESDPPEMDIDRTGQVLRHAVFFSFKEESTEEDIAGVAEAFAALPTWTCTSSPYISALSSPTPPSSSHAE